MNKAVSERELVLAILLEVLEEGKYSHIVLRDVLSKYQYLDKKERAFITRVTEGTLEHMMELDYILNQFSKVKVKKMKPVIRNILRSAVYQLKYMDTVPDSAACNEAVKLAVKKGFGSLRGFVNGVLRNVARNLDQIKYPENPAEYLSVKYSMPMKLAVKKGFGSLRGFVNGVLRNVARNLDQIKYPENPAEYLSVKYSMPMWILKLWLKSYDLETVETMLMQFQKENPLTVRCRNLEQVAELKQQLEQEGVQVERHPYLPYALCISGFDYLGGLPSFQEGAFSVQDISSMLVCEIAAPKMGAEVIDVCAAPGGKALHMAELLKESGHVEARDLTAYKVSLIQENIARMAEVIDVCAAPGGKALHMAELLKESGHVEARDLTAYKVSLIQENIARMGLTNITAVCQDATKLNAQSVEKADIVIADLPCSGLGVLGKKTDLKYKATEEGCQELAQLQKEILKVVQEYIKPGGTLVYSTCTINPAENQDNVHWFLKEHPQFELINIQDRLCKELQKDVKEEGCLQLLPGVHKSDGFFIACMRKKAL